MAANKAPHDLMFALKQYQKFIDPMTRLILIGSNQSPYAQIQLKRLAKLLDLKLSEVANSDSMSNCDVLMLGSVTDKELATFYRSSDVFLCLSDHEGFCVPLVESMSFGIPIVAHNSSAVPETTADAAIIVDKADMVATIRGLSGLLNSSELNAEYRSRALARSKRFSWETIVSEFDSVLDETLKAYSIRMSATQ